MQYIWKYSDANGAKVKHAFQNQRSQTSLCGNIIPWYVPDDWHYDEEGLNSRRECKRCIYVIKVNTGTATPQDHHGVARHDGR